MRGVHHLIVQSVHLKYEMDILRNITVIQGNSATGKTTLVDMIREYNMNGTDTGITISCDVPCRVLEGNSWRESLRGISGCLVFIDEGNRFVASRDFAAEIQGTDNYYIIVTRESLDNLPYSITEIYGMRSSGKYMGITPVYHQLFRIYSEKYEVTHYQTVLTEDSNSGFDFFSAIAKADQKQCISAAGAGNIFTLLSKMDADESVLVIADGAAFGSKMKRIYQLLQERKGITLYLPESFEWIILASGILNDGEVRNILQNPSEYIEGKEFISWERFFTRLLMDKTHDSYLEYTKRTLNPVYLQGKNLEKIVSLLPFSHSDVWQ
ncbi:MAG: translation initiation factor 2 [Eubacterium sp.]|nr:translation initiation factor 2 [Eubacterium sp.]